MSLQESNFNSIFIECNRKADKLIENVKNCVHFATNTTLSSSSNLDMLHELCSIFQHTTEKMSEAFLKLVDDHSKENNMQRLFKYTYPAVDLSRYKYNQTGECLISHIDHADGSLVFIIDIINAFHTNFYEEILDELTEIPEPDNIFAVDLGMDGIFRAVRNNFIVKNDLASFLLIDTGEIITASSIEKMYKLSINAQNIPTSGIPCKVVEMYDSTGLQIDVDKNLPTLLYESVVFHVENIQEDIAAITLFTKGGKKNSNVSNVNSYPISNLNPFTNELIPTSKFKKKVEEKCNDIQAQSQILLANSNDNNSTVIKNNQYHNTELRNSNIDGNGNNSLHNKDNLNELTQKQLDILFEEPLCITNALKAVMGYVPQDEKRICPFSDSIAKKCFKGNSCRFEHVEILKDGWTRDQSELKINIPAILNMPRSNETLTMVPLNVVSVDEFYAQIPSLAIVSMHQLKKHLNRPEYRTKYKNYKRPPIPLELVFIKHSNNSIYRGKVIEVVENKVKVFYVDYGFIFTVELQNIFEWSDRWDYIPFQAFHCYIANICKSDDVNAKAAITQLKNYIENKEIKALVIQSTDELLYVRLTDDKGFDFGELLCACNLAQPEDKIVPTIHASGMLPG